MIEDLERQIVENEQVQEIDIPAHCSIPDIGRA
jgi:hypothetical protein